MAPRLREEARGEEALRGGVAAERGGAVEWIRTTDLLITNQLLYQLSYNSIRAIVDPMARCEL